MFLQLWLKHIHTHLLHAINTRVWQTDRHTYTQTDTRRRHIPHYSIASHGKNLHNRFMLTLVCNEVVVHCHRVSLKSASVQQPIQLKCSGRLWILIISNLPEAFGCPLFFVAVLVIFPYTLSPFGIVAVLTTHQMINPVTGQNGDTKTATFPNGDWIKGI